MQALFCLPTQYFFTFYTACEDVTTCSIGEQCKINHTSHSTYCKPSCDLDNGGCADGEVCSLVQSQTCTGSSCLPLVKCSGKVT